MKAVIELDVPYCQIGQDVIVYFPDTMLKHGKCELLKEQETATVLSIHRNGFGSRVGACPNCQRVLHYEYNQSFCVECGHAVMWE